MANPFEGIDWKAMSAEALLALPLVQDQGDPGDLAFVVVLKRRDGGLPKLWKSVGERFFCDPKKAQDVCDQVNADLEGDYYHVRPVLVHFCTLGETPE